LVYFRERWLWLGIEPLSVLSFELLENSKCQAREFAGEILEGPSGTPADYPPVLINSLLVTDQRAIIDRRLFFDQFGRSKFIRKCSFLHTVKKTSRQPGKNPWHPVTGP